MLQKSSFLGYLTPHTTEHPWLHVEMDFLVPLCAITRPRKSRPIGRVAPHTLATTQSLRGPEASIPLPPGDPWKQPPKACRYVFIGARLAAICVKITVDGLLHLAILDTTEKGGWNQKG
jgi:hypothetical protein